MVKMGFGNSKTERNVALGLCKERKRFIKQAIDSSYSLAAAHVSYIQSLRNIGIALRRYAEAEVLTESSLSTSASDLDKTPSHSSYPSPSPSHIAEVSDSPLHNESPLSPPITNLSYMRSGGGAAAVSFTVNPNIIDACVDDESFVYPMPPPPPPFESGSSWDFFDPSDEAKSFRFVGRNGLDDDFDDESFRFTNPNEISLNTSSMPDMEPMGFEISGNRGAGNNRWNLAVELNGRTVKSVRTEGSRDEERHLNVELDANHTARTVSSGVPLEQSSSKREKPVVENDFCAEREDPSEFITHRAKDFLSSIKDIEHRFFRASEAGKEVSRMLEANKIRVGYSETKGRSSALAILGVFKLVCCRRRTALVSHEPAHHVTKVITWKRSTSSRSSSSRNPLVTASKEDADDSGSDFNEEFCMIAGSHSSTLDRLYAWERKLYDEVKASESVRKKYDRKCEQLRHQFAKDCSARVIDKTRAVVKDLHSRIRVAIHSVDSISKRIEKMRDKELQPQLIELIQGLIRMWKAMLECHHAQYITISLAYHSGSSKGTPPGEKRRQIMDQLQQEIECFGLSFANWVNSLTSYVEALNGWLQNCILLPKERSRGRRLLLFSPRQVLAPPIFVIFRDWSAGIKALPAEELSNSTKNLLSDLIHIMDHQAEQLQKTQKLADGNDEEEVASKDDEKNEDVSISLCCIHVSLTKVLDRLNKFSEASLKMYEDIRQKGEAAHIAYLNCKPIRH
ncbi:hypothetical protein HS088_TW03G00145 [Tripterygium wilfordii]|uniref:Uncharacterized protein n=1 Tax=Tripterygium wilfordii TaxID=458696 RepID=A0A7J7DU48_TRIWF|nr:protein ALTERED PHOSPHATE STARVATION RESPONSE 1-like [Tripterygium wilfordii]KAF5749819.1 hypothetical protein HS088_TW03G00145 [Tripterygium wilfordii]